MSIYFILHLHITYTFDLYYFTAIWPKRGKFKKTKRNFFFLYEMQICTYLLNQQKQRTNCRNVCGATFCKGATHKVRLLKKANFLLIPSPSCTHFKKKKKKWRHWNNRLPFWPDLPLSLPLTRVRTFLMESHLRMSTVLFVLLYKSYTGRVKS